MIEQDTRQLAWENYTADLLCAIQTSLCSLGGKKVDIPLFSDLIGNSGKETKANQVTTDQVVNHLLSKL